MKLDAQELKKLSEGNKLVFNVLYEDMFHSLCLYGYKMISDEAVVVDIVQDVFIELWNRKILFESQQKIKAYLYISVRNKILTQIRDNRTISLNNISLDEELLCDQVSLEETYKLLKQATYKLPKQTRNIIALALKGYGNPEIAEALNISINTVKTLKKNGYSKMRELLKDNLLALFILIRIFM
ncbi:MAG: sigma-70 family RNA polymerase sigma factor [Bacteroidales bacterium]|nr:sigma-70 family RNA polymerase sigma factor [Bacteroidales bacterium]